MKRGPVAGLGYTHTGDGAGGLRNDDVLTGYRRGAGSLTVAIAIFANVMVGNSAPEERHWKKEIFAFHPWSAWESLPRR